MAPKTKEPVSDAKKIRIVSDFILHSPPGEFNEVFNDVRTLVNNDKLLKEGVTGVVAHYNKDQLTPCKIPGLEQVVLITVHNEIGTGRFCDPRSKVSFKYDHLKREAFEVQSWNPDKKSEPWRATLEEKVDNYVFQHYPHGYKSVFAKSSGKSVTLVACIEDHEFQPQNFWNGRWRSQWTVTFDPSSAGDIVELKGVIKVHVHCYEEGNVQLVSSKDAKKEMSVVSNQSEFASEFVDIVESVETEFQNALGENYQTMSDSDSTLKALRRVLPVTRTKMDWNKLVTHKISKELRAPR